MSNENNVLPEEELQTDQDQPVETESNEQEEETTEEQTDVVTLSKSEYTKLKRQAIAYKSQKANQPSEKRNDSSDINRDELYLIAKGFDDKDIEQANIIARGMGISPKEAINSDLFKLYQEKQQAEARKTQAKLRASNSSGYGNNQPAIRPGMTEAEHKEAWSKLISGK